ncbi:hypothetical protein [Aequorivita sp. CIP111184]|uniref:hypothetical protein n=1 Tax=Aequorivita sp. CIP111184 TaxID=2211356 RepID=UPI000DBC17F9|nr:hypothetical protein [Aequorivita sp. CIP111184]SRX55160.1 hypothetical protein AEQU1_02181 [Aequorivita sp. CIP111184]
MGAADKPQLLFYQKMGELFYSIAAADKVVRKEEYEALKNIVLDQWKNLEDYEDPFHTDAAQQIEVVFDWFDYEQLDANDCFESFADYNKEYPQLFTKERKQLIWKTANAIASSFSDKNKNEIIMLAKLKILFKD